MNSNDARKAKTATFTARTFDARDALTIIVASHKVDMLDIQMIDVTKEDVLELVERLLKKNKGSRYRINELIVLAILATIRDYIEKFANKEDLKTLDKMISNLEGKIRETPSKMKSVHLDILGIRLFLELMEKYDDLLKSINMANNEKYRSTVSVRIPKEYAKAVEILEKYKDKAKVTKSQLLREAAQRIIEVVMNIDVGDLSASTVVEEVIDGIVAYNSDRKSQREAETLTT